MEPRNDRKKNVIAHDAILLSRVISERQTIKITFLDSDYVVDQLRWHTHENLGLKGGKVVNKTVVKYWEIIKD